MKPTLHSSAKEQKLLQHARREGSLIMGVWLAALVWSVGLGYTMGYNRDPSEMKIVLGMPEWVFWSVALPWGLCFLFSIWFCFSFIADDDLGEDQAGKTNHG